MSRDTEQSVLIVDDNPRNIQVVAGLLRSEGMRVLYARSAVEALDILMDREVSLILLDIMMPGMNGFSLAEKLKENPITAHIPFIFLTALSDPDNISRGFAAGAVDYIAKPFQTSEMVARVRTHLRLRKVENDLKNVDATRDKLFSLVAHDLKNPLAGIIGITEDLLEEDLSTVKYDDLKKMIRLISKAAQKELELLNNLLQWTGAQTDRIQNAPENVNINDIILELQKDVVSDLERKGITLEIQGQPEIHAYADRNLLHHILLNLLINAIKYSYRDSVIRFEFKLLDSMNQVEVKVIDQGVGMSKDEIDRLFVIDSRMAIPGTENETGSGLGLLICKDFSDRIGGVIDVTSKQGEGTVFKLNIPVS